ncbi:MAG: hypothetical protein UH678_04510 [Fibrobacteraceae bacterium]|nr:hypothetical protein [Fibrobacteraceae bacterium]
MHNNRLEILCKMREQLYQMLNQITNESIDENTIAQQLKIVERINAIIRLEQAEKRFEINLKISLISFISALVSAGLFSYLFNYIF